LFICFGTAASSRISRAFEDSKHISSPATSNLGGYTHRVRSRATGVIKCSSPAKGIQPDSKFEVSKRARWRRFAAPVFVSYSESQGLHPAGALTLPHGSCVASRDRGVNPDAIQELHLQRQRQVLWSSCEFPIPGEISARSVASVGGLSPDTLKKHSKTDQKLCHHQQIPNKSGWPCAWPVGHALVCEHAHGRLAFGFLHGRLAFWGMFDRACTCMADWSMRLCMAGYALACEWPGAPLPSSIDQDPVPYLATDQETYEKDKRTATRHEEDCLHMH